ncbi:MAG: MarR family winged helix-turn-helix transcriptional regulator [Candidatus Acidiferrales bacterium]
MPPTTTLVLPCLCGTLRRSARALTQRYEEFLRPLGLRSSQFTILQVLWRVGETSQGQLGEILAIDSTSLTRTLAVMRRRRWIAERRGDDRRERWLRLAKSGEALLNRAVPLWQLAQDRLRADLGDETWQNLFQITNQLTETAATRQGVSK